MSSRDRARDLVDVQELIKVLNLPLDFAEALNPYVRDKFRELHATAWPEEKRYITRWRNKFLTIDAESLDEMIAGLQDAADTLKAMRADGVSLDPNGGTADDYACLVTTDPQIAAKYDMHDEAEFWGTHDNAEPAENEPPSED